MSRSVSTQNAANQSERKLIINVSYKCNNHCIFCSIADREIAHGDFDTQTMHIDRARAEGIDLLDIDGGEPTLYPRLFELLDYAVAAGMRRITITTNGRMLTDENMVARLARYPIQLLVSLHAGDAATQDAMSTQPGSFRQTLRGLMNARSRFPELGVNTTVTRMNLDGLETLARLLLKLGIKTWNLQYYTPFGDVSPALAPDPYETGARFIRLIERYSERLALHIVNLPCCFMPGHESAAAEDHNKALRWMLFVDGRLVNLADFLGERRFKNGACARCEWSERCTGFWDFGDDPHTGRPSLIRMLDLIPGYPCSAECSFCAVEDRLLAREMDTNAVKREIRRAMAYDPQIVRVGGGEPTERADLADIISYSRELDIPVRSIQTHGFRLADRDYLDSLLAAGLTKVNISVRGADARTHDGLTGVPGSFERVVAAIENVLARPELTLELDAILTRQTIDTLDEQIRFFHTLGARHFNWWFVSLEGRAKGNRENLVPNMSESAAKIARAHDLARTLGIAHFRVYYMPYCFFKGREEIVWHPLEENATVVSPGSTFTLDQGTLDLGVKTARCEACAIYDKCFGLSPGYLTYASDAELSPYERVPEILKTK